MIVAVCSLSGAPGATTLAAAIASAWPPRPLCMPVLVEADASGGDIAAWRRIAVERGLVTLAAASRSTRRTPAGDDNPLLAHAVDLPGGPRTVLAGAAPHAVKGAVEILSSHPCLLASGRVTVLDVGRAVPGTASARLLTRADAAVVVVRGDDVAQLLRVRECSSALRDLENRGCRVGLAVRGGRFSDAEIAESTEVQVWGRIPEDAAGAAMIRTGQPGPAGWRTRLRAWAALRRDPDSVEWMPLLASARGLADRLDDMASAAPGPARAGTGSPARIGAVA